MAISAADRTTIFQIMGVPEKDAPNVVWAQLGFFGPAADSFDIAAVKDMLDAAITGVSAEQETAAEAQVTRWNTITSYDPARITRAGTTAGVIVDRDQERRNIRNALGTILGFAVPKNGFMAEARRQNDRRIIR